jgi:hypothetical protein
MEPDTVRRAVSAAGVHVLHATPLSRGGVLVYLQRQHADDTDRATEAVHHLDPAAMVSFTGDSSSIMHIHLKR